MNSDEFDLPDLSRTCSRLHLDVGDLIEAVLSAIDAGFTERKATIMSIIETLQRRGAYHGRLKAAIDSGVIFQMAEGSNENEENRKQDGRGCSQKAAAALPAHDMRPGQNARKWRD